MGSVAASSGMGIQSVAARLVGRSGITTVVFTSTLTAIVTSATEAMLRPSRSLPLATKRQIGTFLIYGVGAGICGLLALACGVNRSLALCGRCRGGGLPLARRTTGRTTKRDWDMKLGIIGVGAVGAATAMAVALRAHARELVLVDRNRARAKAVATDMHYGVPLSRWSRSGTAIMMTWKARALSSSPPGSTRRRSR